MQVKETLKVALKKAYAILSLHFSGMATTLFFTRTKRCIKETTIILVALGFAMAEILTSFIRTVPCTATSKFFFCAFFNGHL